MSQVIRQRGARRFLALGWPKFSVEGRVRGHHRGEAALLYVEPRNGPA